jgi:hypothetical protein
MIKTQQQFFIVGKTYRLDSSLIVLTMTTWRRWRNITALITTTWRRRRITVASRATDYKQKKRTTLKFRQRQCSVGLWHDLNDFMNYKACICMYSIDL